MTRINLEDYAPVLLVGRIARCYCGATTPSIAYVQALIDGTEDMAPAFFEYRGPVSPYQEAGCDRCGMDPIGAVNRGGRGMTVVTQHPNDFCDEYVMNTRDEQYDLYYCGHDGLITDDAPSAMSGILGG